MQLVDNQRQREAFYLIKKYRSYTWYAEIYRLWKQFCENYERDFYRYPVIAPPTSSLAGTQYTPGPWDEQNLQMFWGYLADMEEGLAALKNGEKSIGHQLLFSGGEFYRWLFSRRFEEIDLSDFGYRRSKSDGVSQGIFADAERAYDMLIADVIYRHTDRLRKDYIALPSIRDLEYYQPNSIILKIPFGVPPGELPPLPILDTHAPTIMSGDEVPAMGIWVVEPDTAHRDHTYCMAYLRPWAPAIETVSEQEYEKNTYWDRTGDEAFRKDHDKIKNYPVRWRLLWQDERDYSNGNIPSEESDYLIYRPPFIPSSAVPARLRTEGGHPCPAAGYWETPAQANSRRYFVQDEILPVFSDTAYGATIWQWAENQEGE